MQTLVQMIIAVVLFVLGVLFCVTVKEYADKHQHGRLTNTDATVVVAMIALMIACVIRLIYLMFTGTGCA